MRALILGGTGLISRGVVKHLLARGAKVAAFNRGQRENALPAEVEQIHGDRSDAAAFERQFADARFDVVIDMIAYTPQEAESDVRAFGGRCGHFIFCSTVCTYGVKIPPQVAVDEAFPQEPTSNYGRGKLAAERIILSAGQQNKFHATVIRPSSTYGPGANLIDNLSFDIPTWDRVERGLPVLCAGDGLGLWVSTHRDDVGKLFAYAALSPKTYGQAYNATREQNFTWRDYYREAATALGTRAKVVFMPAAWIIKQAPQRFGLLAEITQFHGAYSAAKARRDVPEFRCEIEFVDGARGTLADMKRRGTWKTSEQDQQYDAIVKQAMGMGMEAETL